MVVLPPHGDVVKTLPAVRLATLKSIVSVYAVVGVELLATTLAGKHMATVLPNFVLARQLQRLESFVTYITGVNYLSLVLCPPHTDPIQQRHDFPHKPALNICRARCQHMSTPLHVLLKADPHLKGDVADDKADPSVCLQLNQYFLEMAGSMDHQHVLRLFFLSSCHRGCTIMANKKGWPVASDMVPQEAPVIHHAGFFVYLYNVVV